MKEYKDPKKIIRTSSLKKYIDPIKILKTSGSNNKTTKTAQVKNDFPNISSERKSEEIIFITNRTWGSTYTANITFREIESSVNDNIWLTHIYMYSTESGNMVYKKYLYHKNKKDALSDYNTGLKIITELRNNQEINNIPTATIPNMLWYSLKDLHGDEDLKPKSAGNIVYLRQDHNIKSHEDSKGNLFKNILYLDKSDNTTVEHTDNNWTRRNNYF
jgi:hypothetical protein